MLELLQHFLFGNMENVLFAIGPLAALGGGALVGSLASGIMGANAQTRANRAARKALREGANLIDSVDIPSIQEQMLELERLYLSGELTPQQEKAILQRRSELEDIVSDPRLRQAQMEVLNELDAIVQSEGLDPMAMAQVNQLRNELSQQERASREAIIQSANRRGVGGSGLELAAQLQNQQGAAQRGSQQGFDIAAQAQQRALDALQRKGQMSGNIRAQDFDEAARRAAAQDEINRFNVSQRTGAQQRNINRDLGAQEFNLNRADNMARTNLDIENQERMHNTGLIRQNYLDRLDKAKSKANILGGQMAQNHQTGGQIQANMWGGIASGLGKVGGTLLSKGLSDTEDPTQNPTG
jgi:hypothetical protein